MHVYVFQAPYIYRSTHCWNDAGRNTYYGEVTTDLRAALNSCLHLSMLTCLVWLWPNFWSLLFFVCLLLLFLNVLLSWLQTQLEWFLVNNQGLIRELRITGSPDLSSMVMGEQAPEVTKPGPTEILSIRLSALNM